MLTRRDALVHGGAAAVAGFASQGVAGQGVARGPIAADWQSLAAA